jgi:hypothetical protein
MSNTNNEWGNVTALRAEQIAHLARYATIDMPTHIDISEQHVVTQTLYTQVEHIQSMVLKFEGFPVQWSALQSYKRFNRELAHFTSHKRQLSELETILAKRKEMIRDIVYGLTHPITRVSIELERHKLIALAYLGKELLPLITMRNEIIQAKQANQTPPTMQLEVATNEAINLSTLV